MKSPMWSFGVPPDAAAWCALVVALAIVAISRQSKIRPWLERLSEPRVARVALLGLGILALSLSGLYVAFFLRGAPRIIDATSYFLEGRMLSEGSFSFDPPDPSAAFRGRFLTGPEGGDALGVIFPPGYPLFLALGFALGKPMWMGPLLGLALVFASYGLALRLFERRDVALLAAALSVCSAALRYHTADTMSHGWAALLFALSLYACTFERRGFTLLAGVAAGWLLATRPLTGVLALVVSGAWLWRGARRQLGLLALGTLPGALLLVAHQHAVTGSWFTSSQLHYYALADGPPGCFGYGFGDQIGCRHEHAQFVAERLQNGFGLWEALRTTLHRIHWHTLDLANFEPLWLVMVYAAVVGFEKRAVRVLIGAAAGIALVYLPFYFNGSYPGGGARFLIDTIALEHVLLAWGAFRLGLTRWVIPAALFGYAVHAVHGHRALAAREGGRPMFEPARLADVPRGLVLVGSDHGFNLGFDPANLDPKREVVVARERGDANDYVLWDTLGRPRTYRYGFDFWKLDPSPRIRLLSFGPEPTTLRYEAESNWPPSRLSGGWAEPRFLGDPCASRGRGLDLNPTPGDTLELELETHTLTAGSYDLVVGWVRRSPARASVWVRAGGVERNLEMGTASPRCPLLRLTNLGLSRGQSLVTARVRGAKTNLDFAELRLRDSSPTVKGASGGNSVDN